MTTDSGVEGAGCKAEERIIARSGVPSGIASSWWRAYRLRCWRQRKAGERERHENQAGG